VVVFRKNGHRPAAASRALSRQGRSTFKKPQMAHFVLK